MIVQCNKICMVIKSLRRFKILINPIVFSHDFIALYFVKNIVNIFMQKDKRKTNIRWLWPQLRRTDVHVKQPQQNVSIGIDNTHLYQLFIFNVLFS